MWACLIGLDGVRYPSRPWEWWVYYGTGARTCWSEGLPPFPCTPAAEFEDAAEAAGLVERAELYTLLR